MSSAITAFVYSSYTKLSSILYSVTVGVDVFKDAHSISAKEAGPTLTARINNPFKPVGFLQQLVLILGEHSASF